jgi:hypothetical protein
MKLLLIEDNPTLAHWLAKMLGQEIGRASCRERV